ncbi:MAG: hypothetical protein HY231_20000 [Acidobacteria bacterium]|nr:hypothetical protein [Acidobacteriota bacterium]
MAQDVLLLNTFFGGAKKVRLKNARLQVRAILWRSRRHQTATTAKSSVPLWARRFGIFFALPTIFFSAALPQKHRRQS